MEEPVGPIEFKVMLGHKKKANEAKLYRKKIGANVDNEYDLIKRIPFNEKFKMYDYTIEPDVGFVYKLEWDR